MEPDTEITPPGLTPPDQGPMTFKSREREEDRTTRKPMILWDRVKFLILLAGLWLFFVMAAMGGNPILSFDDAVDAERRSKWWLLALIGVELLRQLHYYVSERLPRYHAYWTKKVFPGFERRTGRLNDWTRFRIARVLKWALVLVAIDLVVARLTDTNPLLAVAQIPAQLFVALPFVAQLAFAFFFVIFQFVGLFWFLSRGGIEVYFPDDVKTRFTDVWGQDPVLERIKENILFLEAPEAIEEKGGYVPGGILLWGPPGTGKTLMAEAVAGETGRPYVFVDPGAFSAMFMGIGVMKVKSLFRKLRKLAVRYGGVIVFFDEADSLGNRGQLAAGPGQAFSPPYQVGACHAPSYISAAGCNLTVRQSLAQAEPEPVPRRASFMMGGMGGGGDGGTLQALLAELSGLKKPRGFFNRVVRRTLGMRPKPPPKYRILVMMASNMPQALDAALLRPGRIDRIYKVGYPSKAGRVRTYEGYLAKVSHQLTPEDVDKMATITPYATGASIKDLVNEALITAIRSGRDTIRWSDMITAKHLKELGPPENVEYIERERHAIAVHEACHAVAAYRVRRHLTIDIATIEKGGDYLGMVASIPPEDQFSQWRSEYEADIMVFIASLAGERLFFDGDNTSGVSSDLEHATQIATYMEGFWGMGSSIACHGVTHKVGIGGGGKGKGEEKEKDLLHTGGLGERIEDKLVELMDRTRQLLEANRTQILALAHALETYKTIPGEDVHAIIEGRRGPLIDGTPYGQPEFKAIAEDYHSRVMAAHRGHGRVDIPLPLLNGQAAAAAQRSDELGDPTKPLEVTPEELAGQWARPTGPSGQEREAVNGDGESTSESEPRGESPAG
jgi:ATP-dependent Zn protease